MWRRTWPKTPTVADFPPGLPDPANTGRHLVPRTELSPFRTLVLRRELVKFWKLRSGQGHRHLVLIIGSSLQLCMAGKNGKQRNHSPAEVLLRGTPGLLAQKPHCN